MQAIKVLFRIDLVTTTLLAEPALPAGYVTTRPPCRVSQNSFIFINFDFLQDFPVCFPILLKVYDYALGKYIFVKHTGSN